MTTLTDPAREYAELCEALAEESHAPGDAHLANKFGVKPWSSEFYQIVFCIIERANRLVELVDGLGLDEDFAEQALNHIAATRNAFGKEAITNTWYASGAKYLAPINVQPLKMLSPMIRAKVSYPRLSDAEADELQSAIEEFLGWLSDHQLSEQDFIRQALIDGLEQFHFRLSKVRWLGWGYTIQSLKDVIAAYKLLESSEPSPQSNPDAQAALIKGAKFFGRIFEVIGVTKEAAEKADFLLKAYGAISLIQHGTTVTGLLTHLNG